MSGIEHVIAILKLKLNELVNKINDYDVSEIETISRISGIVEELKTDPFLLGERDFRNEIDSYLKEIADDEQLADIIDNITDIVIVCDAKKRGINVVLNSDELAKIDAICEALMGVEEIFKQRDTQLKRQKSADEILRVKYSRLYDKLIAGDKGLEHFTDEEIDIILELIKYTQFPFKFKVLDYIRNISNVINKNIVNQIEEMDDYEEENTLEIDEEIIRNLFIKYHYEYDKMPDKYKKVLRTKCKLERMIALFEYIEFEESLSFVKNWGNTLSNAANKAGFEKLVLLLRYATTETLDYIVNDAKNRGVDVVDIFKIDGVYKHVSPSNSTGGGSGTNSDELTISGSFEYYKGNEIVFDELSKEYQMKLNAPNIDFFKTTLAENPDLFKRSPKIIKANLEILKKYRLNLVEKNGDTYQIKSPSILGSGNLTSKIDLLLEATPMYDYILKYPSILKEDLSIDIAISLRMLGRLEFTPQGKLKHVREMSVPLPFDMNYLADFRNSIPKMFIDAASEYENINSYRIDDVVLGLEENTDNKKHNGLTYNLNETFVSKYKFSKVWTAIMDVYDQLNDKEKYDIKELLLFALTYNSFYTASEFYAIKSFVEEFNYGGNHK